MIKIRNCTKYHKTTKGKHLVFDNASVDIPSDKNIVILGNNGAGKSTLLRILGGVDFPNTGSIRHNYNISWPIGLINGFNIKLSAKDNVKFICRLYNLNENQILEKAALIEEFADIGKFFNMPLYLFSAGMRARLFFGISLYFDFDYYLIDELLSVGDKNFKDKSQRLLDHRTKNGKIILVTHELDLARDWCDIALVINNRKFDIYHDIDEAIDKYAKM